SRYSRASRARAGWDRRRSPQAFGLGTRRSRELKRVIANLLDRIAGVGSGRETAAGAVCFPSERRIKKSGRSPTGFFEQARSLSPPTSPCSLSPAAAIIRL